MSRKNKQRKITAEDLGGLDLTVGLPAPPPAIHVDMEIPPPQEVEVQHFNLPELAASVQPANGLTLDEALRQSPYNYLAAHPSGLEGTVIVTNGRRFWSATEIGLNPNMNPYNYDMAAERERTDWRPIHGNENGLYIA